VPASDTTIVLVHGAFADGSSWDKVIPLLQAKCLKVVSVQNPLTSLADDVAAAQRVIDAQTGRVILVGHSLGGMLSVMVAKQRPDLVRCVVLLDSPVVAGWRALLVRLARNTALGERFSPSRFSARRRKLWPDAQAAYEHFAAKDMFAIWAPQVLRDYIDSGLVPHPEGVQLRFTREVETDVYRSLPHHIGGLVKDGFPVPIGFIGGTESGECRQAGLKATRKLVGKFFRQVPGGHLFPMENPELTAQVVREMITALLAKQ